ncbi:uncharacterized protein LOC143439381 [Arvicanthis niloticus]|uniref:uncharacterized protein LOC143310751 n=1 Tax=Arvicanthis niloticus TaxID=61156 RepID=UPI00402BE0D2
MGNFCSCQDNIQVVPVRQEIPPQKDIIRGEELAEPVNVEPRKKRYHNNQVLPVRQEIPPQKDIIRGDELAEPVNVEPRKKRYHNNQVLPVRQEIPPQKDIIRGDELAEPVNVEPRKKCKTKRMLRDVRPSGTGRSTVGPSGDLRTCSSTSGEGPSLGRNEDITNITMHIKPRTSSNTSTVYVADKSCGPADDVDMFEDRTENDFDTGDLDDDDYVVNEFETHDIYEGNTDSDLHGATSTNSFEFITDTDDSGGRDYPTSTTGISSSDHRELTECSSGFSDDRQMKSIQEMETNPPGMEVDSKDHGCLSAILTKLRCRPTNSSRVKTETSPVDVAAKACGLDKDLNEEDQMKSLGKEATVPWVSGEEVARALTRVPSRRRRFITAMLKKCGIRWTVSFTHDIAPAPSAVTIPSTITGPSAGTLPENKAVSTIPRRLGMEEIKSQKGPDGKVLYTAEKACSTNDIDDMDDNIEEMCEQNQMKASQEDADRPALVKVLSEKWHCLSAILQRLGSVCGQHHEISGAFQPQTVFTAEKACGTQDDVDMFEDRTENDFDTGDLDNDDVLNEFDIHDIYEAKMENDLRSDTSLHSFNLDTDNSYKYSDTKDDFTTNGSYKQTDTQDDSSDTSMKSSDCSDTNAVPVGPPHRAWEDNRSISK